MITKFKIFEKIYEYQSGPKVGDYIITPDVSMKDIDLLSDNVKTVEKYFRSNIGKVIRITDFPNPKYPYKTVYIVPTDILERIKHIFTVNFDKNEATIGYSAEEILYWSDNYDELKEKLDIIINVSKYNL